MGYFFRLMEVRVVDDVVFDAYINEMFFQIYIIFQLFVNSC